MKALILILTIICSQIVLSMDQMSAGKLAASGLFKSDSVSIQRSLTTALSQLNMKDRDMNYDNNNIDGKINAAYLNQLRARITAIQLELNHLKEIEIVKNFDLIMDRIELIQLEVYEF